MKYTMKQNFPMRLLLGLLGFCILTQISALVVEKQALLVEEQEIRPPSFTALADEEQEKWNNLVSWITENGGFIDPRGVLATRSESGVRGMFATEDIAKDTIIAKIPNSVILKESNETREFVTRAEVGASYVSGLLTLASEIIKGTESHWKPYLALMPNMDAFVEFHPAIKMISLYDDLPQRETLAAEWDGLVPGFGKKLRAQAEGFDRFLERTQDRNAQEKVFDDRIWDRKVMEMSNTIRQSRMWADFGYLPYMDFFNHRNEHYQIDIRQEGEDQWMVANRDIKAGDELYDNYGIHDNQALFRAWGFCDWTKNIKYKRIPIDVQKSETIMGHAVDFMLQAQHKENAGVYYLAQTGFTSELHKLLRTSSLDARDLGALMLVNPAAPTEVLDQRPISLDNEAVTFSKAITLSKVLKNEFRKTIEECRVIAAESKDYLTSTLAKICVEDLEILDGFEATLRSTWANYIP